MNSTNTNLINLGIEQKNTQSINNLLTEIGWLERQFKELTDTKQISFLQSYWYLFVGYKYHPASSLRSLWLKITVAERLTDTIIRNNSPSTRDNPQVLDASNEALFQLKITHDEILKIVYNLTLYKEKLLFLLSLWEK